MDQQERERALEALAEMVAERGVHAAHATRTLPGLGARSFRAAFGDGEGAVLAAFELSLERARPFVADPFERSSRWLAGVRAAVAGLLRFLEHEPALGRLLVVSSAGAGAALRERRMRVLGAIAGAVARGEAAGRARPGVPPPPAEVAQGVVGAVQAVLENALVREQSERLIDLYGPLVSIVVLPYLGAPVARRELERPPPAAPRSGSARARSSARGRSPGGRLGARSARVLRSMEEQPGQSNSELAAAAGIVDQGQASRLLARLAAQGLAERTGGGRGPGSPNSWRVTDAGRAALEQGAPS